MQSLTDMRDCAHGPKANCHKCMFRELVGVLEGILDCHTRSITDEAWENAHTALEKAKLIDPACIPREEAAEERH